MLGARAASEPARMTTNVTFDGYILFALLMLATIVSIYLAGRIAERRGRSFRIWAWIAAFIGPLALPLLLLFPNLHGKNGGHA
jgi:MFS family permease